jgi:hypothetical protein
MDTLRGIVRRAPLRRVLLVLGLALAVSMTACSTLGRLLPGGQQDSAQGNPLPTPRPGEEVGAQAVSAAKDTPEGTWEGYLRDIVASRVAQMESRIALLERYENPDHTVQNLGGTWQNLALLEDRTEWRINGRMASSFVDFDVRVTFANGDTDTRRCRFELFMQHDSGDGVWYVLSPRGLDAEFYCH